MQWMPLLKLDSQAWDIASMAWVSADYLKFPNIKY